MQTKPYCAGNLENARVLVIGHDPRLQNSNTQAEYAFFADYFFKSKPTRQSERAKYEFAEKTYSYIEHLTSYRYSANKLVLTNLCNVGLPHAPDRRTVLIPKKEAVIGVNAINEILEKSDIKIVFAMSEQVNYWLQKLKFYESNDDFLNRAEPRTRGVENQPPYYQATQGRAFQLICGNRYTDGTRNIYPILHSIQWPLRGNLRAAYSTAYESLINHLKN